MAKKHTTSTRKQIKRPALFVAGCGLCFLCVSLLCLCGCARSSPWSSDRVHTGSARYDSSKLYFRSEDRTSGIDVEILRTHHAERIYLSVHSRSIPPYQGNPKKAIVQLRTKEEEYTFEVIRHEGGQCLLLLQKQAQLLLSLLEKREPLFIKLQGYSTQISAQDFPSPFE